MTAALTAIVSLHDVMPETFSRAEQWVERLRGLGPKATTLLVVPGGEWSSAQARTLRIWQEEGFELVSHGWSHRLQFPTRGLASLHRYCISRNAGEHLGQTRAQLYELLVRSHAWFGRHDMAAPEMYVPPAWALGQLSRSDLAVSPFRFVETTTGILECKTGRIRRLPLLGYEADTTFRALFLTAWNRLNRSMHTDSRPLRLSIHPYDDTLRLSQELDCDLRRVRAVRYREIFKSWTAKADVQIPDRG